MLADKSREAPTTKLLALPPHAAAQNDIPGPNSRLLFVLSQSFLLMG